MEEVIRPCDKESLRMAMIKHEETFKEQVHELHRLYQIQKLLMKTMGGSLPNRGATQNLAGQIDRTDFKSRIEGVDPQRHSGDSSSGSKGTSALDTIEESQIELTLWPSSSSTTGTSISDKGGTQLTSSSLSSSTGSSDNIITSKMGSFLVKEEQFLKSGGLNHPPWSFQVPSLNST